MTDAIMIASETGAGGGHRFAGIAYAYGIGGGLWRPAAQARPPS